MSFASTTVKELEQEVRSGKPLRLLDVRTPAEFGSVHATVAKNLPLDRVSPAAVEAILGPTTADCPLYVICKAGGRSRKACDNLAAAGMTNLINVDGGTDAWVSAGLPVERGAFMIPVEGQVKALIGALAILGAVLASYAHPAWIWLSGAAGAAMLISGITGFCGIAAVFAKMPWNQRGS
jgi:rhodanese-related sulfurtransferase